MGINVKVKKEIKIVHEKKKCNRKQYAHNEFLLNIRIMW